MNFFYKISNDQEWKKKGKREVQKFEKLEDERSLFGKIKSFLIIFVKIYFDGKNKFSQENFIYEKFDTYINFTRNTLPKFVSST